MGRVLGAVGLVLAWAGPAGAMPGQCGIISGTITDVVSGHPVEGIVVHMNALPPQSYAYMATTDEDGHYSASVFSGCTYRVDPYFEMRYPTSNPANYEVGVAPGQEVICNFTLNRSWAPSVSVSPPDGTVVGNRYNVTVTLHWQAGVSTPSSLKVSTAEEPQVYPFMHVQTLYDGPLGDLSGCSTYQMDANGVTQVTSTLVYEWDTRQCRNSDYKIAAEADFLYPYDDGPTPVKRADFEVPIVRNLVIHNVAAHPGADCANPDFVLFDPAGPQPYLTPEIRFEIVDDGIPLGPYTWTVFLRDLSDGDWENGDFATVTGTAAEPGQVTAVVNGSVQGQEQSVWLSAKGVYAFDIEVVEAAGLQSDSYWARWPHKLQVPSQGFSLHLGTSLEGGLSAKVDYTLSDSGEQDATAVACTIIAPDLSVVETASGLDTAVGVPHTNVPVSDQVPGAEQPGTYYAILRAEDSHGTDPPSGGLNPRHYRERGVNRRMLAVVASAECALASVTRGIGHWFDQAFIDSAGDVSSARLNGAGYIIYNTECARARMLFSLERSAVWVYVGHSRFDAIGHWDNDHPENDLTIDDLNGKDLSGMRFAVIYGCWSASATERDWPDAFEDGGARCALGWTEEVSLPAAYDFFDYFFQLTCSDGLSVSEALPVAVARTESAWHGIYTGVWSHELHGDTTLVPPGNAQ